MDKKIRNTLTMTMTMTLALKYVVIFLTYELLLNKSLGVVLYFLIVQLMFLTYELL